MSPIVDAGSIPPTICAFVSHFVQRRFAISAFAAASGKITRRHSAARRCNMDWRITELKAYIDQHAGGVDCNLKRACQELRLNISPGYARYLFRREIGLSVKEYAKRERLLMAMERLIDSNVPVKTIAAELGYRRTYDFTRLFKQQYCLSPTKFRKKVTAFVP
jgi:methylphosphotriester-DNA--protein-cysteine methyltransferase